MSSSHSFLSLAPQAHASWAAIASPKNPESASTEQVAEPTTADDAGENRARSESVDSAVSSEATDGPAFVVGSPPTGNTQSYLRMG